jgi:ATP-dependent helicase IRC3
MEWLKLRDYQHENLNAVAVNFFARPEEAVWRQLTVLPTGCGKTVVAGTLRHQPTIQQWLDTFPTGQRRIMFIAHTDELIKQAAKKIKHYNPDLNVQVEKAEQHADIDADVVVASVATLAASNGRRMGKFDFDDFRIVIIDEAHHAVAGSYQRVMQYFKFLPPDDFMPQPDGLQLEAALAWQRDRLKNWDAVAPRNRLLMGITATSRRGDKIGLELVFQKIVFQRNMLDMIKAGYLANMRALRINSNVNLDNVKVAGQDLDQVQLGEAINTAERNRLIVKSWLEHAKGKKTIAFTVNISQATSLAAEFQANGVRAEAVSGKTTDADRERILKDFEQRLIDVIVNCQILTEGFDDPEVECIIMARPTKSQLLYVQMAGRGVRLHPCDPVGVKRTKTPLDRLKKPYCLLLDIVDVTSKHRLIAAPTLVGLPANFDTQGVDLVEMVDKIEQIKAKSPYIDVEAMTADGAKTLDQIEVQAQEVDLFEPFHDPDMEEHSNLAWMKTEPNHFEVSFPGPVTNESLIIQQNTIGQWEVLLKEFGPPRPVGKPALSMEEAFDSAEMWLEINRSMRVNDLKRDAGWRQAAPNPRQISKIKGYKLNVDPKKMTRGEAASIISLMESRKRKAGR